MTINLADNSPRISYAVAQGATQTSFAVPFEFFASADLNVYVDGTLKTLTTHYTVSGGDGSTGTVTISVTGATGGSTVVITRDVALERTTDFPSSGPFQIGALNTELDRLTAIAADLDDKAGRALQVTDYDVATGLTLPEVNDRKGKTLAFNASSGAVEAGPTISDVQTVSAASADIQTLAHIEDGTDATDAIQTVAGIASNVSTVAGVSSAVSTVAGISSNVTAVAADATDIGVVAGKATEIGRLGTAQAVADLDILATTDAVSDMNTLAAISSNISTVAGISANVTSVAGVASLITSDFVADLNTLATSDIVSDLNTLATADIVSDLNTLATSDIVSDLNTLATADIVSDLNTLATTEIVSDLNILATTDIVTDLNLLATSAIVEDLNLLATSTVIADMATLAGAGANPNISSLGVSGTVTAGGLTVDTNTLHVDATNNRVGIGTSSPLRQLSLQNSNSAEISLVSGTSSNCSILMGDGTTGTDFYRGYIQYQNSDDSMIFATSISERMRIDSSGNVGIGTSSPSAPLQVAGTTNGLQSVFGLDSSGLKISTFQKTGNDAGVILDAQESSNGTLTFATTGTERMRIISDGTVLVGKTASNSDVVGVEAAQDGHVYVTVNNTLPLYINRQSGDELLRFASNGSTVGKIGVTDSGDRIYLAGGGAEGVGIDNGANAFVPTSETGAYKDSHMTLGRSDARFTDLHLSGSIEIQNGTGNTGVGKTALNSNTGANNTALGFEAGYSNSTGVENTYLGRNAGYYVTSGNKNTIVGAFHGNQGGLDIRTSSNNIVLSDGDGNPRVIVDGSGSVGIGSTNPIGSAQRLHIQHPAGLQTSLPTVKIERANNVGGGSAIPEIALDVSVPSTYNNATEVYGIKTYAAHNLTGTGVFGIFAEVEKGNSDNHHAGFFRGGHSDTNGISKPKVVYIDQTTTVGAANSGYSIGCMIKQDNYTKNEFMRWDTDYSGSDTMNALRILRNGSQIGGITTTTSSTSYNTSSDYRLKENVTDVTDGITRIKQLAPKRFNFIAEPDKVVDGFIAHEAQAVVPEAVTGTQDALDAEGNPDYQGIDQAKLVPLLTAALQEAIIKIETLEAKVTALENA